MMFSDASNIIELQDVVFNYPDGSRGLDRISIAFPKGKKSAVLGLNGAGKTTLFLHCNGILKPRSGRVLFGGTPFDYSRKSLCALRSRVGLVFQNPDAQLFSASVREDVSFGPMNMALPIAEVRRRVEESLDAVGMLPLAEKPAHSLSYGQKKRVCIAGVLAMKPEVLILDEPMAGLDVSMQQELLGVLEGLHDSGITVVIATHDIDFAYQWADRINLLAEGRCTASWDAFQLPSLLNELAGSGVGVPKVAELFRQLVDAGALGTDSQVPRSHQELLELISNNKQ
jgi:cobalt/nickel transport system ATP-binding protein